MKLDKDIKEMSSGKRGQEIMRLRRLIRTHKSKKDNARCWMNDEGLYRNTLPEGSGGAGKMDLPMSILLRNCEAYIRRQKCSGCEHKKKKGV